MPQSVSRRTALRTLSSGAVAFFVVGCGGSDTAAPAATTTIPDLAMPTAIPTPTGSIITRWPEDPWTRGAYSFLAEGSSPDDRATIATALDERLWFAGEAVDRWNPATVHGAHNSGRKAALAAAAAGHQRVVIIGAGIAGLAAGRALVDEGIEAVIVEAQDRPGGRIKTDRSLGPALDLGASWIQGPDGNVITTICDAAGIERVRTDYDDLVVRNTAGEYVAWRDVPGRWRIETNTVLEYAADVEDLAAGYNAEGASLVGIDVIFPDGYDQVVDVAAEGLDITLEDPVTQVTWGGSGVEVLSASGTRVADAVIVTVPLGVLKAGAIDFEPALPAGHLESIDRLGMGHLQKVYLQFDEVFWDPDISFFGLASDSNDRFPWWMNLAPLTGDPVLVAFHGGDAADALIAKSDEAIVADAVLALEQMFGLA
ncbi:MAG: FAD-dependent oxidoreductase [Actinomycetota bacterium]